MQNLDRRLPDLLVARAGLSRRQFLRTAEDLFTESYFELLRDYRPFGGRARIGTVGLEHVQRAGATGRGILFWVVGCVSSDLVAKMAFRQAGLAVWHLSRPTHGFSRSRFGVRVLNPIRRRREDRYLAGRVVIDEANSVGPLRTLYRRLRGGEIVALTAGDEARKVCEAPFLGRTLRVAPGAPEIAWATGAALLPVFTVRNGPGDYTVIIEPEIPVPAQSPAQAAVEQLVSRLESFTAQYPLLWTGWRGERLV